jgi:hypothetical protein
MLFLMTRIQPDIRPPAVSSMGATQNTDRRFGFEQLYYESRTHGMFSQHHIVWQKKEAK